MEGWAGVVLAAGRGSRMRSRLPKVLHRLCGRELLSYPVAHLRQAGLARVVVVLSPAAREGARAALGDDVACLLQPEPLGTGHAALLALRHLGSDVQHVLITAGDLPLVRPETLCALVQRHLETGAALTLLSSTACPPEGLGRVVRDGQGRVTAVVEEAHADPQVRGLREVNASVYCLRTEWAAAALERLPPGPKGEVYLTDLVAAASGEGLGVGAVVSREPYETLGVNTRAELAQAEQVLRQRVRQRWMEAGVTLVDPATVYIDDTVELGEDTVVHPNTHLLGHTRVAPGCTIGPNAILVDTVLGEGCRVVASVLEGATLEEEVHVGPFSHLRPGAYLERGVHVGNFAEVKNSRVGRGTQMGHFSYLGDATVGAGVNIGAGTVTCNYDGVAKHRTEIGEGAFIGSDTMLIAPVRVGPRAATGAGAVVTRDVPPDSIAVGVPARMRKRSNPS